MASICPVDQDEERLQKINAIFNMSDQSSKDKVDINGLMSSLERMLVKELRTWWDCTTLQKYVDKEMIPRGLRIKKKPTSTYSETFLAQWQSTLSDCSFKLMELIIQYEQQSLADLREEVSKTQQSLTAYAHHPDFIEMDNKLKNNLAKLETIIIQIKQSKFNRDYVDYTTNTVYNWMESKAQTPKSILKKSRGRRHNK